MLDDDEEKWPRWPSLRKGVDFDMLESCTRVSEAEGGGKDGVRDALWRDLRDFADCGNASESPLVADWVNVRFCCWAFGCTRRGCHHRRRATTNAACIYRRHTLHSSQRQPVHQPWSDASKGLSPSSRRVRGRVLYSMTLQHVKSVFRSLVAVGGPITGTGHR